MKKRWGYSFISIVLAVFVFLSFIYAAYLSCVKVVWIGKSIHFLVSENTHIEASVQNVRLDGGAGYLLERGDKKYVALSVYFNEEDGKSVQVAILNRGEDVSLLTIPVDKLYFKTCQEKEFSSIYQGALECLYGCMEVLGLEIARLDKGATQQSSLRILSMLLKQLRYLSVEYEESFALCASVCKKGEESLQEMLQKQIYTKDLRYLLCDLSVGYLQLASKFSL